MVKNEKLKIFLPEEKPWKDPKLYELCDFKPQAQLLVLCAKTKLQAEALSKVSLALKEISPGIKLVPTRQGNDLYLYILPIKRP